MATYRLDPFATQTEELAGLRLGWNLQFHALAITQARHLNLTTQCSCNNPNRNFTVEIISITGKQRVLFDPHLYKQISRGATIFTGLSLSTETYPIPGIDTARNLDRERLLFFDLSGTMANITGVFDLFTRTMTGGAGLLYREEPLLHTYLADTTTGVTGHRAAACFGSGTTTLFTDLCGWNTNLTCYTGDRLLQRKFHTVGQIGTTIDTWTTTTAATATTAEDVTEDIFKTAEASAKATLSSTALNTGMPKLVIGGTLLAITEDLVGLFDLFELGLRIFTVGVTIRVKLHRHSTIGLLQIGLTGIPIHTEHFVVISFRHIIFQLVILTYQSLSSKPMKPQRTQRAQRHYFILCVLCALCG